MKNKNLICSFLLCSVWISLFAPYTWTQNQNEVKKTEKKGLRFRVREGTAPPEKREASRSVQVQNLDKTEIDSILNRLPPIETDKTDTSNFVMRPHGQGAPRTGSLIATKFPADEQQNSPTVKNSDPANLEVVRFAPDGPVSIAADLSVTFSQAMIAVTSNAGASTENVPVKLKPAVKGKWRWLGTKTLVFDAENRFPMATKFTATIPAGTRSAAGGKLSREFSKTFSTPPVEVTGFPPVNENISRDALFFASFNQEINAEELLQKISVVANGKRLKLRLAQEDEIKRDEEIQKSIKLNQPNRWIAWRTVDLLPPDSKIDISFEKGLPSAEGPVTSTAARNFSLYTLSALKNIKTLCGYDRSERTCRPVDSFYIEFNNQIDAESFDKSLVRIEPSVDDASIWVNDKAIFIEGIKKPLTNYEVKISGELKDKFGQTLGKDFLKTFTVGAEEIEPGRLYQENTYKDFTILDPSAKPSMSVYSINHESLKVKVYAVKPEDYQLFRLFRQQDYRGKVPAFGKLVYDQTVSINSKPNEPVETRIDIGPALTNGYGHAILIVEPTVIKQGDYSSRIVSWLEATQIGIDAFADNEQLTVFASDLKNGQPLSNVQVALINGANGTTDENGISSLDLEAEKNKLGLLIAKNGDDTAILPERNNYDFYSGWVRQTPKDSLRWFVFNDRNIYRTGETVSIKGYVRQISNGKFADISESHFSTLNYVLKDPRGNEVLKGAAKLNLFGSFDFQLKLPPNLNLGYQKLELTAASSLPDKDFTHNFQVQEFRRPEFEVTAGIESAAPFYIGSSATIGVEAKYYSGGFLANAETSWNITARPTNYTPPGRTDFIFGKFTPWWQEDYYFEGNSDETISQQFKGTTGADGKHHLSLDFVSANPARPYRIDADARVQDVNRQTFAASTSLLVHPSEFYVGLRSPKTFVKPNERFKIETITTDIDGKSVSGAPVSVLAELKDWQQIKGKWQKVTIDTQTCQIRSSSDAAAGSCDFTAKQGGSLTITASVADSRERRSESELTVWVAGGKSPPSRQVKKENVELIPGKKEYAPNETAEILVNSPFFPATGILTLRRNGIVKTQRFTMNESSTVLRIPIEERYLPNIHVQVDLAGATGRVAFEDERDTKLPSRPAFAGGELNLNVSTGSRKLNVKVEPVIKTLRPGDRTTINVAVTDNNGNATANSEVALLAVDESVLALTNYKIPDAIDIFYQQIKPGTEDYHSRDNILLASPFELKKRLGDGNRTMGVNTDPSDNKDAAVLTGKDMQDLPSDPDELQGYLKSMAGRAGANGAQIYIDGFSGGKIPPKANIPFTVRKNFDANALFAPSVVTAANGKASVEIQLPDNLTRYRITAVAVTKSKQFGLGEAAITARQPLMVRPSAPRFMNFGDKIELPVVLQNQTDDPMKIDVAVRASNAALTAGNGRQVLVPANDRVEIRFPVAAENAGLARFQIAAVSGNGDLKSSFADAAEIGFPVYTPATSEAFAAYGTTDQNGTIIQPVLVPKDVYSEFGGLEITTSSTQLQELTDAFIYLQNYPFECSEQISSRILSVTALRDVLTTFEAKDLPSKEAIQTKMIADLERLQTLQHPDGGFSFWRSDDKSLPYLSVHVAHALARAHQKGYKTTPETITKALAYLKNIESKYPPWYAPESRRAISAYALYVRDLLGDKDVVKSRDLLREATIEKLSPESLGWILSVLADDKDSTTEVGLIKRHLLNRVTETAGTAHFVTHYTDGEYVLLSSDRRADGVILEALLKVKSRESSVESRGLEDLISKIVRGLLANKTKGRWATTQENVFILLALDKYFQTFEKVTPDFVAKVWLGEALAAEQKFAGRSTDSSFVNIPMNYLQQQTDTQNLILDKRGAGRLYYRIGMKYAPKNLNLAAADYGFTVTRSYEGIDNAEDVKQNPDGSWTIKAGARVRVKIQMVVPTRRYHVALVDKLPAGLEIINPDLAISESVPNPAAPTDLTGRNKLFRFEHQNLRDEQVEAFTSLLWEGVWNYSYVARATTPGKFTAPPAKAEEMYAPETFGRSRTDFVTVQ